MEELHRQIRQFKQNYLVVEVESLLLDTAMKLEGMVRQGNTVRGKVSIITRRYFWYSDLANGLFQLSQKVLTLPSGNSFL